jgi:hypothetical protein
VQKTVAGAGKVIAPTAKEAGRWIGVTLSDGRQIEVHPEDFSELWRRDPGLTAHGNQ